MITKNELDALVTKYETEDFIKNDPIQFPHRGKTKQEIELYGFIASLFAYGNRKVFISKLNDLFQKTDNDIVGYVLNNDFRELNNFEYRFAKDIDIIAIFKILNKLYTETNGLSELFEYSYRNNNTLQGVVDYFYSTVHANVGQGFYHMIPNTKNC